MKNIRYLVAFAAFAILFGFAKFGHAQNRGIGAEALVLDDTLGHTVVIQAPRKPSAEWTQWQSLNFPQLTWSMPVPPANHAQSGFVYTGPLSGAVVPQLAYWLPPHTATLGNNGDSGGYAGAWDYAGKGQLGIVSGSTTTPTHLSLWKDDTTLGTSNLKDSLGTIYATEPVVFTGPTTINTSGAALTSIGNASSNVTITGDTVNIEDAGPGPGVLKLNATANGTVYLGNTNSSIFLPGGHYALGAFDDTGIINVHVPIGGASGTSLDQNTSFMNFVDATGGVRGTIQGQSYNDWTTSEDFIFSATGNALTIAQFIIAVALSVATFLCAALPTELPVAICTGVQLISNDVQYAEQIIQWFVQFFEYKGNLGVAYSSSSGDYAEYLRRADTSEHLSFGDIVGESNGVISMKTEGAQSVLSISQAPIVLGNTPPKGEERFYNKVGFLGQVPVKVRGEVKEGDFIVPSGFEDGTGIAISPDQITPDQFTRVVGRSWESSKELGIKFITIAAGLNAKAMSEIVSRQQEEIDSLKQVSIFSSEKLNLLEQAMLQTDPAQRVAILNQAQQLNSQTIAFAQNVPNNGQQMNSQQNISQNPPAQNVPKNSNSQGNIPSKISGGHLAASIAAKASEQATAKFKQSMSNQINKLLSNSDTSLVDKVQQMKSFATAKQAILSNLDKIANSADSRASRAEKIRQFFKHPDDATRQAIAACVYETIGQIWSAMPPAISHGTTK